MTLTFDGFEEGQQVIAYHAGEADTALHLASGASDAWTVWSKAAQIDWQALASDYANNRGRSIETYLPADS